MLCIYAYTKEFTMKGRSFNRMIITAIFDCHFYQYQSWRWCPRSNGLSQSREWRCSENRCSAALWHTHSTQIWWRLLKGEGQQERVEQGTKKKRHNMEQNSPQVPCKKCFTIITEIVFFLKSYTIENIPVTYHTVHRDDHIFMVKSFNHDDETPAKKFGTHGVIYEY